ncbi:hypothetical protein GVAV_000313 [Gurleya vavrai]
MKSFVSCESDYNFLCYALGSVVSKNATDPMFLIITGDGKNGKTLLCRVIQTVFDEFAEAIKSCYFTKKNISANEADPTLLELEGKKFEINFVFFSPGEKNEVVIF